jgi:tetratricopeptide (TPR) repeat protein
LLFHALGEYEQAEVFFRAALARYRVLGNPRSLVFCLTFCSPTLVARGNAHEAQVLLRESFMLASAAADRFGMAIALQHLGVVALEQQQPDEAVYLFHEAVGLMRTIGSRWDLARALNQFGAAQWAAGKLTDAGATYREALATALEAQAIPDALQALAGMAAYAAQSGRYADALALATRILRDRSARTETQAQAEQVRRQTYARLAAEDARAIEHATATMPLAELARSAA